MGSLTRVNVHYRELQEVVAKNSEMPVMGTFLEGENVYTSHLPSKGMLLLGNEANGISAAVETSFLTNLPFLNLDRQKTQKVSM
jgi:RNA methyltransferase, TrmH family